MTDVWPTISIIMPVYNEEEYISQSLGAMLSQEYPAETEVIVVDGMSTDRTRLIVSEFAASDRRVSLLDNPQRIVPVAMNIGITASKHDLIARMDGHAVASADYLLHSVTTMKRTGADNVGGRIQLTGSTYVARAICAAMDSPFGAGPAAWRTASIAKETDTVPFGLWHRERLLALGGFDPTLIRNQDYELNIRLRNAGGFIYFDPEITTAYYSRQTLHDLSRQYYQYGVWKIRVGQMHPSAFRLRHWVAPVFVLTLIFGVILVPMSGIIRWVYFGVVSLYVLMSVFFSIMQALRHGLRYFVLIPIVFWILHIAWGVGALVGVFRWWIVKDGESDK